MSEIQRIENAAVGGAELAHTEASEPNELGSMEAEAGFETTGSMSAPPIRPMQRADLGEFLQRLTPITTFSLATTDTALTFSSFLDPWTTFLSNTVIARKVADYRYIRGTLEVEVSVNVPSGCYGLYYLVAIPNGSATGAFIDGTVGFTPQVVECCPHVAIDVSSSTKGKLVLPWISWNDYGDIADHSTGDGLDGMWDLRLVCYVPLAQGSGTFTPTGSVVVYARCARDVDLLIPYQQMKRTKEPRMVSAARAAVNNRVMQATGGLKASAITGKIAGAASTLSGIPIIGALAAPVAAGAAAATSVLEWFGFTRTTDERPPLPIVFRPFSNVANADGYDTSEIAGLSVGNSISIDPRMDNATGEDESSFDYLTQKYVLIGYFPWEVSAVHGAEICSIPISPFFSMSNTGNGAVYPMAGYLGLPFSYWRGDMEYKIVVPVSKFHRGTLQVSWSPLATTSADATNNEFNHIFDVTANSSWEFTVGYASAKPMLDIWTSSQEDAVFSVAGANGKLRIAVVNPLEAQVATADAAVLIFARAKPGIQFAVPRTIWSPVDAEGTRHIVDFATSVRLQAGALGDEAPTMTVLDLVPPIGDFPVKEVCVGEEVRSARMLVQKFSRVLGISRSLSYNGIDVLALEHIPAFPALDQELEIYPSPQHTGPTPNCFNWFGWYAALFVGVASSTRYKVLNAGSDPMPVALYAANLIHGQDQTTITLNSSLGTVSPTWVTQQGEGVEITVPYYFNHKYIPTCGRRSALTALNGTREGRVDVLNSPHITSGSTKYPSFVAYSAAGPDVRFHVSRFPRPVFYAPDGSPAPIYGNLAYVPPG